MLVKERAVGEEEPHGELEQHHVHVLAAVQRARAPLLVIVRVFLDKRLGGHVALRLWGGCCSALAEAFVGIHEDLELGVGVVKALLKLAQRAVVRRVRVREPRAPPPHVREVVEHEGGERAQLARVQLASGEPRRGPASVGGLHDGREGGEASESRGHRRAVGEGGAQQARGLLRRGEAGQGQGGTTGGFGGGAGCGRGDGEL
mmetsp:Transcript_27855/g.68874  ORF Transcript_27855/g.68874 Transcript_27855/m.68874 type:complete len:203 (+) Transcript_27855:1253-1861(+)